MSKFDIYELRSELAESMQRFLEEPKSLQPLKKEDRGCDG